MKNIDIREVKELFQKLLDILERFGDDTINIQKKVLQKLLCIIEYEKDYDKKIIETRREYLKLYPARGGLSEFFIWCEDFEKRKSINDPLDAIRERLWEIFK